MPPPPPQPKTNIVMKEKVQFSLAKMDKGGSHFEVVLKNPDLALEVRHGKEIDMHLVLDVLDVFEDAKKGEKQSPAKMKQWLGTENPLEAAKVILRQGELALTAEQRKKMFDAKKKKIIDYIHMNALDPKTRLPHPVQRIELAMEQAKVHIDAYQQAESQIENVLKQLKPIIPLSFEKVRIKVLIPAKFAGSTYAALKSRFSMANDKWNNDGSVQGELEFPAGLKPDVYNLINKMTQGEAVIEEMK